MISSHSSILARWLGRSFYGGFCTTETVVKVYEVRHRQRFGARVTACHPVDTIKEMCGFEHVMRATV